MMSCPRTSFLAPVVAAMLAAVSCGQPTTAPAAGYAAIAASPDGIGKAYLGREIARVMGHEGAEWLERDSRQREERTDLLLANLELKPTDVVADVGAGTGYFTFRIAPRVPRGKVLAVDVQPEMIEFLNRGERERKLANVEPILGTVDYPKLPAGTVDVALLVDAYHEFDHPAEMMSGIVRSLAPGGRVVLVEYRGEDDAVPIKPLHKLTQAQAIREMAAAGLAHVETRDVLPWQHLMIFRKAGEAVLATRPTR